jgi:serine/threonine protein kinase
MDQYEKIQRLGSGAFGTAYKVKRKTTGQILFLKKINLTNPYGCISLEEVKKKLYFFFNFIIQTLFHWLITFLMVIVIVLLWNM